jgi:maltose/maltodextrin transport system substrate-binding protein/arabinogalactan oligomer/maltooligosaccharide transport system substrate-binding protein
MVKRILGLVILVAVLASLSFSVVGAQEEQLVIWADDTRSPILQTVGEAFTAEFGIPVVVQELGFGNIRDNFLVAGPAGEGPDIIIAAHDWLGRLVSNGAVAPIDLGDLEAEFLPAAVQAFVYDGVLYGMPYAAENVAFFRNTDLVPDAPATWDDVRSVSESLVAAGSSQYGYIIQTQDPYHLFPLMTAFGGYVFGQDDTGSYVADDVGIDSEGAIAAAQWLQGMVEAGLMPPPPVDYDVMHSLFESADAAMMISGPWALPRIRESGVPYAVSAIPAGPAGPGRPFLGVQGFMISAFSENQLLAESFLLDYVATADVMQAIFDADPRPSAFLAVRDAIDDPDIAAFAEAGANGLPMPSIPQMDSVWTAWGNAQGFVIRQELTAEEAFAQAGEQIRGLISGFAVVDTTTMTIAENLAADSTFASLLATAEAAGMSDALSAEGPMLVFAPTNDAFTAALEAMGMTAEEAMADVEGLTQLLQYHVVPDVGTLVDALAMGTLTTALEGATLTIAVNELGETRVNDAAQVIRVIPASNGTILVVNAVLLPPAEQ